MRNKLLYKMSTKKAQGLSLNVIIIAGIVLIVLLVLWAIFTGKMTEFNEDLGTCRAPASCQTTTYCNNNDGSEVSGTCPGALEQGEPIDDYEDYTLKGEVCCLILK